MNNLKFCKFSAKIIILTVVAPLIVVILQQPANGKILYKIDNTGSSDNFQIYAKSNGEFYKFSASADDEKGDTDSGSWDYEGRKYKMKYEISPVYMVALSGFVKWDFLQFNGQYSTDRVIKKGGTIDYDSDISSNLEKSKIPSEIIMLGIDVFNIKTFARTVNFNYGTSEVIDVATKKTVDKGNLDLSIKEFSARYDFVAFPISIKMFETDKHKTTFVSSYFVGYKYMEYSLPRIVYYMEDKNPDAEIDDYVYVSETKPQQMTMGTHMFGVGLGESVHNSKNWIEPIMGGAFYVGATNKNLNFDSINKKVSPRFYCVNLNGKYGLSIKIFKTDFVSSLRFYYDGNLVFYSASSDTSFATNKSKKDGGTKSYDFGSTDVYHGFIFAFDVLL